MRESRDARTPEAGRSRRPGRTLRKTPGPGGMSSGQGPRMARVADTELAEELLQIEEADAWFEYLEATRGQTQTRYAEVEPWAWARLSQRLRAVRARRTRLRPAAA
jgi:hypothetical protein